MASHNDLLVEPAISSSNPEPDPDSDPTSHTIAQIFEIIPDIESEYLLGLVEMYLPRFADETAKHVLDRLLDGGEYPTSNVKRKGKDVGMGSRSMKKMKLDYATEEGSSMDGAAYGVLALIEWLAGHLEDAENGEVGMMARAGHRLEATNKGKEQQKAVYEDYDDDYNDEGNMPVDGSGVECQCCFGEYALTKIVYCPSDSAHPFCTSCLSQYAATKLGSHDPTVTCMHPSGCTFLFTASSLRRILPPPLMDLFERLEQQKELEEAALEGLEGCPFCDWKCVLEVPKEQDKLFRCENEEGGCGVVSCRICKKDEHLPKSCQEVEAELMFGDSRLWFEEAMSKALMRNCPNCKKAFIKEYGCNVMTCTQCATQSCYVCRKAINGHDHFYGSVTCPLSDNVEERHETEVKAAAKKALEEYQRDHPDADGNLLKTVLENIQKQGEKEKSK